MDILDLDDDIKEVREKREEEHKSQKPSPKKKGSKGWSAASKVVLAVSVLVFLFAAWQLVSIFVGYKQGSDEYKDLEQFVAKEEPEPKPIEASGGIAADVGEEKPLTETISRASFDELKAINSDIVGWIEFENIDINYPVVQTGDNDYYLTHTVKNTRNSVGSIFVEYTNNSDFQDDNTFIYGHNMKNGSMFGLLKKYKDPSYYQANQFFWIYTPQGDYMYQIFSCHEAEPESETYTNGFGSKESYASYLQTIKDLSLYDTGVAVTSDDKIVSLSTCTKDKEVRFVVHAKRL
ncbi:class B sortase [Diplocloster modestus]|uniref:Class B sortase n=1 Tax=Diplocloster modestus TaxID=2850322 RepID=A0ABS6K786_9FIRM|nr:class B sortase [Diplocloster modestus]MBU9726374.1 class B sortase [Diplocloster modestus]